MRRIIEFHGKPQATGGVTPYGVFQGEAPAWRGARAEVLVVDCLNNWESEKRREGDSFEIEGDLQSVRAALTQALAILDASESSERARIEQQVARAMVCPRCGRWADPVSERHGDGQGGECYGLLDARARLAQEDATRERDGA